MFACGGALTGIVISHYLTIVYKTERRVEVYL